MSYVNIIANMLSPSHIVLAGGVSSVGDFLLDKLEVEAKKLIFPEIRDKCKIVLAELGNDAGVIGAAKLVKKPPANWRFRRYMKKKSFRIVYIILLLT